MRQDNRWADMDRDISQRLDAIYSDPKRHKFYSCNQASIDEDWRGPRGGQIRGKHGICFHCGQGPLGHATETESL